MARVNMASERAARSTADTSVRSEKNGRPVMQHTEQVLERLAERPVGGYHAGQSAASEPTALAALALAVHRRDRAAHTAAQWLLRLQAEEGSVGVRADQPAPRWATPLAVLAWRSVTRRRPDPLFEAAIDRGCRWILRFRGKAIEDAPLLGHNTRLVAWPWVEGTHSWVEPTAFCVLALKATGRGETDRCREGVAVLVDRLLPAGGCNYGNTFVMGRQLRPHVQPTALALLALRDEPAARDKLPRSIATLVRHLTPQTPLVSLAWALQALAANRAASAEPRRWLDEAAARELSRPQPSTHRLALLALAAGRISWDTLSTQDESA